jgi:VCBS repeat-containing protein
VLGNDSDVDDDTLTAELIMDVKHGSLTLRPDGSFTYQPRRGFFGTDGFTYRATDGVAGSLPASVTLQVVRNRTPLARNDLANFASSLAGIISP